MTASRTDALDFSPTNRTLAFAIDELAELGAVGGGAVAAAARQAALRAYLTFPPPRARPARMRHDYAALGFADLTWDSGRMRVPTLPLGRVVPQSAVDRADLPALAVENAGGIVHAASSYLQAPASRGDGRVTLASLGDALRHDPASVAAILGCLAPAASDRFVALATAFQNCGAFVDVPAGVALDAPLQVVWAGAPGGGHAIFPQTVVRVGAGARVTIVERHVGNVDAFLCGTVEIDVGAGAHVDYVVVQQIDDGARALVTRTARCARAGRIAWHLADLGGALVRSVVATDLAGDRARAETNALFFARGFAHVDLHVTVAHDAAATSSRSIARAAANDRGVGRFYGDVRTSRRARGTDAIVRGDGLVLSRNAHLEAAPTLEIATNDVAARQAATIGSLDEEQLFYVRARGIARGPAERMLALAFFEAAIARFPSEALRDEVRTALDDRLDDIGETFST